MCTVFCCFAISQLFTSIGCILFLCDFMRVIAIGVSIIKGRSNHLSLCMCVHVIIRFCFRVLNLLRLFYLFAFLQCGHIVAFVLKSSISFSLPSENRSFSQAQKGSSHDTAYNWVLIRFNCFIPLSYHSSLCGKQGACWHLKRTQRAKNLHHHRTIGVFFFFFFLTLLFFWFLLTRMYTLIFLNRPYRLAIVQRYISFSRFWSFRLQPSDCIHPSRVAFYCLVFSSRYNSMASQKLVISTTRFLFVFPPLLFPNPLHHPLAFISLIISISWPSSSFYNSPWLPML